MKTIIDIHVLFKFRLLQTHLEPEYWLQSLASARPSQTTPPPQTKQNKQRTNPSKNLKTERSQKVPTSHPLRAVTIE